MKDVKTNALRMLDKKKIHYEVKCYEYVSTHRSAEHILPAVGVDVDAIYKTLVLQGNNGYLVCCIPILAEIDLKKLAKASGNKKVEMVAQKDLLNITGYIRGGCSPVGMKKVFPTYFQEDILLQDKVSVSAGKQGLQVVLDPQDLISTVNGKLVDVMRLIE